MPKARAMSVDGVSYEELEFLYYGGADTREVLFDMRGRRLLRKPSPAPRLSRESCRATAFRGLIVGKFFLSAVRQG